MKRNLEKSLPSSIWIGSFNVNVKPLRSFLIEKRLDLATRLLNMFTAQLRVQIEDILNEYKDIHRKLKEDPFNIERVFEIREWMETIPLTVKALDETVQKLKLEYDVLDQFWWNLSDDDFALKYEAMGFPLEIQIQVNRFLDF